MAKKKNKSLRGAFVRSVGVTVPRAGAKKKAKNKRAKASKKKAKKKASKKKRVLATRTAKKIVGRRAIVGLERRAARKLAANRALAEQLIAAIGRRKKRIVEDFHAIGRALTRLSAAPLYGAMGYATFEGLLAGEKLMGKSQAYKLMAVAEAYPVARARELGFEKAYGLVAYTEATPAADLARTLAEANPRIAGKRLKQMTVRELAKATRRVRETGSAREVSDAEKEARKVARELQRHLRAKGAKSTKASARHRGGRWRIQVDVALDEVGVLH